jgi:hypothetical protein
MGGGEDASTPKPPATHTSLLYAARSVTYHAKTTWCIDHLVPPYGFKSTVQQTADILLQEKKFRVICLKNIFFLQSFSYQ